MGDGRLVHGNGNTAYFCFVLFPFFPLFYRQYEMAVTLDDQFGGRILSGGFEPLFGLSYRGTRTDTDIYFYAGKY